MREACQMETLPTNLQKLISENGTAVRDALRRLRESGQEQEIRTGNGEKVVIRRLRQEKPAA
jgi:flagellar basal body-associated protein FliL